MVYVYREIGPDGKPHGSYRFQITLWNGKRTKVTGSRSKTETLEIAELLKAEQDAIRKGWKKPPKASDFEREFHETVEEYLRQGELHGGRGGHPWCPIHAFQRRRILRWWEERLDLKLVSDLVGCLPRVDEAFADLKEKGLAGKTLSSYRESLVAFGNWCVSRGYLESAPLRGLSQFDTTPRTIRRALTVEEVNLLLDRCAPERRIVYEVAIKSGLRVGELRSLKVRNLTTEGFWLDAEWTKNRKSGHQVLPDGVLAKLREIVTGKSAEDALFDLGAHPERRLNRDLEAAGIQKWTPEGKVDFHSLRVTYITLLDESGASVAEARELARHASPYLTYGSYVKTRAVNVKGVARALEERISRVNQADDPDSNPVIS